jgi:hypothetical protein
MKIQVNGMKAVQNELRQKLRQVENATEEMISVMMMAISANTAPYVPVDTSALINSETRETRRAGNKHGTQIIGEISYGADGSVNARGTPVQEYAAIVHEGPQKNWQKPTASNLFLAKGTRDFIQDDLSRIISAYSS